MNDAQNQAKAKPFLVRLGLLGLPTRRSAVVFVWISVVLTITSLLFRVWAGSLFLLAALWYWLAIRWVDRNGTWES